MICVRGGSWRSWLVFSCVITYYIAISNTAWGKKRSLYGPLLCRKKEGGCDVVVVLALQINLGT